MGDAGWPNADEMNRPGRLFGVVHLFDVGVVLFLLFLLPVFTYGYKNLLGLLQLEIRQVRPSVIEAGPGRRIELLGSGFDPETIVEIDTSQHPFVRLGEMRFISARRLSVELPAHVSSGWHYVIARNSLGRLVQKRDAFRVLWRPRLLRVVPSKIYEEEPVVLRLVGRYFEKDCTVILGEIPLTNLLWRDSSNLEVPLFPPQIAPGSYSLILTNPDGRKTQLRHRLKVGQRRPKIERVLPHRVYADQRATLEIFGESFLKGCRVSLGGIPWNAIQYLDSTRLRMFLVPASMEPGRYQLEVTNPNGLSHEFKKGVEVLSRYRVWVTTELLLDRIPESAQRDLMASRQWRGWIPPDFSHRRRIRVKLLSTVQPSMGHPEIFYQGKRLVVGSRIGVRLLERNLLPVVVSPPVSVIYPDPLPILSTARRGSDES